MAAKLERRSVLESGSRRPAQLPDFSPQAVSKAVLSESLQKPHVLYPTAIGVLGGLGALLLGPTLLFVAPAVAGLALGAGGWALDYTLRKDRHARDYVKRLHEALAGRVSQTMAALQGELRQLDFEEGLAQLDRLRGKYQAYEELLRRKLNPDEITFGRYLGMGEQVFLGGLDNLARISDTLKGFSTNSVKDIQKRIQALRNDGIASKAQDFEEEALLKRLKLLEQQREKVFAWLAQNEQAMTELDHVMAGIAEMDTAQTHATMNLEESMKELETLAKRARDYSVDR